MSLTLESLSRCFQGFVPSGIATCAPDGTPNVTFLSQVYYVDSSHVALSCQFFNKTRRNVLANPHARVEIMDPMTLEIYRLRLRYSHSETEGPLFEAMALRIQAIASITRMEKVFRLIAADVYDVLGIDAIPEFLSEPPIAPGITPGGTVATAMTQLLGGQLISQQINQARDLDQMLGTTLKALDEMFGMKHSMVLVPDETGRRLVTLASHGYGESGVGAEVALGEGVIGTVAEQRRVLRVSDVMADLRYSRAIRQRVESGGTRALHPEIPLPGLPGVRSQLALPLLMQDRLVGVLAVESERRMAFDDWDEAFLQILANQVAFGIDKHGRDEEEAAPPSAAPLPPAPAPAGRRHAFTYFPHDECVFVDGEYLIRNVPGKILWKLLTAYQREGRTEFSNRELRLDGSLGLPALRDNLESRLVLLRRRLEQQCPDVRLVSVRRGRFALELAGPIELIEKSSA